MAAEAKTAPQHTTGYAFPALLDIKAAIETARVFTIITNC